MSTPTILNRTHYMADGITDPEGLKAINSALRAAGIKYVRVEPVNVHRGSGYRLRAMYATSSPTRHVHRPDKGIRNETRTRRCYRSVGLDTSLARIDIDSTIKRARLMDPHPELYTRYARALEARERRYRNDALAALADHNYAHAVKCARRAGIDADRAARIRREVAISTTCDI